MTIVIMVCVWHAIVPAISFSWGEPVAQTCDVVVAAVLGTLYVIAHIGFAFVIAKRVSMMTNQSLLLRPIHLSFSIFLAYTVQRNNTEITFNRIIARVAPVA